MVTHGHELVSISHTVWLTRRSDAWFGLGWRAYKIEEQLPTTLHFHLHRAAPFERRSAADDQGQVVRPQLRVVVRRMVVCISGAGKDGAALDARLQALLP